jgi:hypothetical protein
MPYLSFSAYKLFNSCPKAYWHRYIDKTTPPKPDNCVNSLYGSTIGTVFEVFYRDKVWTRRDYEPYLQSIVEETFDSVVRGQRGSIVDWDDEKANYHSRADLIKDVREGIPRGLQVIRQNRFIGQEAEAEMKLDTDFGPYRIGGRADFVIRRVQPHGDLVILDGKGSKWRDKYVEPTQLKWYAMLYRARFGVVPDGLGFVFWRFEGEQAVQWISFTSADLDVLHHEIIDTMKRIETGTNRIASLAMMPQSAFEAREEYFPAAPSFGCNLCSYLPLCEEGLKKYGPKVRTENPWRKPKVVLPGDGVRELSLGEE